MKTKDGALESVRTGAKVPVLVTRRDINNCPAEQASPWRNPLCMAVARELRGFATLEDDRVVLTRLRSKGIPDVRLIALPTHVVRWLSCWRMGLTKETLFCTLELPAQRLSKRDLVDGVITEVQDD